MLESSEDGLPFLQQSFIRTGVVIQRLSLEQSYRHFVAVRPLPLINRCNANRPSHQLVPGGYTEFLAGVKTPSNAELFRVLFKQRITYGGNA
jgi:hypothetical protein